MVLSFQTPNTREQHPSKENGESKGTKGKASEHCLSQKVKSHVCYNVGWRTRKGSLISTACLLQSNHKRKQEADDGSLNIGLIQLRTLHAKERLKILTAKDSPESHFDYTECTQGGTKVTEMPL